MAGRGATELDAQAGRSAQPAQPAQPAESELPKRNSRTPGFGIAAFSWRRVEKINQRQPAAGRLGEADFERFAGAVGEMAEILT